MAYNPYNPDEYLKGVPDYGVGGGSGGSVTSPGGGSRGVVTGPRTSLIDQSPDNPSPDPPPVTAPWLPGPGSPPSSPCAPGYEKQFKPDGSFECVPHQGNTTCPPGQTWDSPTNGCIAVCPEGQARDGRGNCVSLNMPGKETASSGGGGGPVKAGSQVGVSPYDAKLQAMIMEYLQSIMGGRGLPFSEDMVNKLKAGAFQTASGQAQVQQQGLAGDLARAGLSRSGAAIDASGAIARNQGAQFSKDSRTIAITAVQENFKAKQSALQSAQDFLNSERANQLSTAQVTLAYAQLNQQWKSLLASFDQQMKVIDRGDQSATEKMILCIQTTGNPNC